MEIEREQSHLLQCIGTVVQKGRTIKSIDNVWPDILNLFSEIFHPISPSEKLTIKEFKSQGVECQLNVI